MCPKKILNRPTSRGVTLQELPNRRRFRYRYIGTLFNLTLPPKGILPASLEELIKRTIEFDLVGGQHDPTQEKYRAMLNRNRRVASKPSILPPKIDSSFVFHRELKDYFKKTGRGLDKNFYFHPYQMALRWGNEVVFDGLPQRLEEMNYSCSTYNTRKAVLSKFCDWMVRNKRYSHNPFLDVPSKKNRSGKPAVRKKLTDDELKAVLEAIRTDRFVKKYSFRFKHSDYYPIFLFLALTGVRPAEAIGLQVDKVDSKNKTVLIDQALARTRKGTCNKNRVMKSTKTGSSRELPFDKNPELERLLKSQCRRKSGKDLVFTSANGLCADDRAMNDTVLKPVLHGLGISPRILYCFRHSFISRCFQRNMDIKTVQTLTGHRDLSVLLNTYAEVTKSQISIPRL